MRNKLVSSLFVFVIAILTSFSSSAVECKNNFSSEALLGLKLKITSCVEGTLNNIEILNLETEDPVIFVSDLTEFNIAEDYFLNAVSNINYHLVIDGVCSGECSRLMLPMAKDVTFLKNSFAALTDSSFSNILFESWWLKKSEQPDRTDRKFATETDIKKTMEKIFEYHEVKFSNYVKAQEELNSRRKYSHHLIWYSFVFQSLSANLIEAYKGITKVPCHRGLDDIDLIVILDEKYFRPNQINYNYEWALPNRKKIVEQINKHFDNPLAIHAYDRKPFYYKNRGIEDENPCDL